MCRLFAIRSTEPVKVTRAFDALKQRSHEHKDGWGVALFDGNGSPSVEVSVKAAHACERFEELTASLQSRSMLTHIRLASRGEISEQNTHPFWHGNWAFMHNGTLQNYAARREHFESLIDAEYRPLIRGGTDSERCFFRFLTEVKRQRAASAEALARALAHTVREVVEIFDAAAAPEAKEPTSANFVAFDGETLIACRHGKTLFHAVDGGAHFIASEPLWPEQQWEEIPEDTVLAIDSSLTVLKWPISFR